MKKGQMIILTFPMGINKEELLETLSKFANSKGVANNKISMFAFSEEELFTSGSTDKLQHDSEYIRCITKVKDILSTRKGTLRDEFVKLCMEGVITEPLLKVLAKGPTTGLDLEYCHTLGGNLLAKLSTHVLSLLNL